MPTINLLDSNSITALLNGNVAIIDKWANLPDEDELVTCFVVVAEWEYGILNARDQNKREQLRSQGNLILSNLSRVIQSSWEINMAYGQIAAELRRAGTMIPQNDIWIAAVARSIGATVVTNDGHFLMVSKLSVIDWTK